MYFVLRDFGPGVVREDVEVEGRLGGFPATSVAQVRRVIDPTTAE